MSTAVYNPTTYAALPTISQAAETFLAKDAASALPAIGKIFVENHLEGQYGIGLLHRHFDLPATERLVEYRGTTTPWPTAATIPGDGDIVPTTWDVSDGAAKPYEFEFIPKGSPKSCEAALPNEFVKALGALLVQLGLHRTFGLVKTSNGEISDRFEATVGRTSLVFPANGLKGVPAMWQFEDSPGGVCVRVCSQCKDFGTC